tara:strand:- start:374 stop:1888 length:1515 start_codon:yes stop_codon:yes gene_type:complete
MANELDKTIEELESEVLEELEEAEHGAMKLKPNATATDPMQKLKTNPEDGGMEAIPGSTPDKVAPHGGAAASKGVKSDTTIPKKGKADKMDKAHGKADGTPTPNRPLAASYDPMDSYTDDEIRELCHSKDHDCATMVEHPQWGKGKPILRSHAIPDDNGYVEWYDVQFKHGIEEKVMAEDMRIIFSEDHGKDEDMHPEKMTKTQLTATMDKMLKMAKHGKKDDMVKMVNAMYGANKEGAHEGAHEDDEKKEAVELRLKSIDVSEHVDALVDGEGDLSEEFKKKAATVFEAAVKSKVRSEVERMEEDYRNELEENINATKDELTEKVDTYLNYVVEEWMKENELAIERGLKGEIAEDFISGLKQLFEDHYVDVPDEKYDVLEAQSEKISELEGKINEMMEKSIELKNTNATLVKEQVVSELSSDLAETEIEKFKGLVEDVDYSDEESYREKLATLKESYFPSVKLSDEPVSSTIDDVETGNAQSTVDTTDSMAAYMSAIGRSVKK